MRASAVSSTKCDTHERKFGLANADNDVDAITTRSVDMRHSCNDMRCLPITSSMCPSQCESPDAPAQIIIWFEASYFLGEALFELVLGQSHAHQKTTERSSVEAWYLMTEMRFEWLPYKSPVSRSIRYAPNMSLSNPSCNELLWLPVLVHRHHLGSFLFTRDCL